MKILRVKLRGFIGIKEGLGLEEMAVDLSNLDGLVSISGPNGSGKTTFLESLHPHRSLFSRKTAIHRHVYLRDSLKELEFEFGGNHYRTVLNIDAKTGVSEGFIYKNGSDESLVDGKLREYDNFITDLLGSKTLFCNSVFCPQGARPISDLTTGEFKSLLIEMLPVDQYARNEVTAAACIKSIDAVLFANRNRHARIVEQLEFNADLEQKKSKNEEEMRENKKLLAGYRKGVEEAKNDLAKYSEAMRKNDGLEKSKREIEDKKDKLNAQLKTRCNELNAEVAKVGSEINGLDLRILMAKSVLDSEEKIEAAKETIKEINSVLKTIEKDLSNVEADIKAAESSRANLCSKRDELTHRLQISRMAGNANDLEFRLAENETKLTQKRKDLMAVDRESKKTVQAQAIKTCKNQISALNKRDKDCTSLTCSFIANALKAERELPALLDGMREIDEKILQQKADIEYEITIVASVISRLQEEIKAKKDQLNIEHRKISSEIGGYAERIRALDWELNVLEKRQEAIKRYITGRNKTLDEMNQVLELESKIKKAKAEKVCLEADKRILENKAEMTEALIQDLKKSMSEKMSELDETLSRLVSEIDLDAADKHSEANSQLNMYSKLVTDAKKQHEDIVNQTSNIGFMIKQRNEMIIELEDLSNEIAHQESEVSQWTYLRKVVSKNGLQSLEIDGAAPLITAEANDLLSRSLGKSMSMRLVTQDPDTLQEILEIMVIREDGSETLLANMCGGEKAFILKALRLGITLVAKEKSGLDFKTFLSDEEDTALDSENTLNFINLYRAMIDIGNFNVGFYISHTPAAVAMADHQIKFGDGQIVIS